MKTNRYTFELETKPDREYLFTGTFEAAVTMARTLSRWESGAWVTVIHQEGPAVGPTRARLRWSPGFRPAGPVDNIEYFGGCSASWLPNPFKGGAQ